MTRCGLFSVIVLAAAGFLTVPAGADETADELFEEARYLETATGDLLGALDKYREIIREYPEEEALVLRATYREGFCQELLGEDDEALKLYKKLLRRLPKSHPLTVEARRRIERVEYRVARREKLEGIARLLAKLPTTPAQKRIEWCHKVTKKPDVDYLPVIEALLEAPEAGVRLAAIDVLKALGTDKVLPYLRERAADESPAVRLKALDAYNAIEERLETRTDYRDPFDALGSRDPRELYAGIHRIKQLDPAEALPRLRERLHADDPLVRYYVVLILGELDLPEAVEPLKEALVDTYAMIRVNAAQALFKQGDRSGRMVLRQALKHEDPSVRNMAASHLSHFGDKAASPLLLDCLASEDPYDRELGVQALRRLYGVELGFQPWGSAAERERAAARWAVHIERHAD